MRRFYETITSAIGAVYYMCFHLLGLKVDYVSTMGECIDVILVRDDANAAWLIDNVNLD